MKILLAGWIGLAWGFFATAAGADVMHSVGAQTLHDAPGGAGVGTILDGATVERRSGRDGWAEVEFHAWIHASAFKLIPESGGRLMIGAAMGMKADLPDRPDAGRIFRSAAPEMAGRDGDFVRAKVTAWVKADGLRPGKGVLKSTPPPPPPPPAASETKQPPAPKPSREPVPAAMPEEEEISVEDLYGKSWAVAVGIGKYNHWPDVADAVSNAREIQKALKKMKFDRVDLVTDKSATRQKIEDLLGEDLPKKTGKDDRVLIYLAGRGVSIVLPDGKPKGYFIPADCPPENIFSSAISLDRLGEIAEMIPARHVLVVVDACLSDRSLVPASNAGAVFKSTPDQAIRSRGAQILVACAREPDAGKPAGEAALAPALIRGIGGPADLNGDGRIPVRELVAFLQTQGRTAPFVAPLDGGGEMIFRGAARPKKIETPKPAVQSGMLPDGIKGGFYMEESEGIGLEMVFIPGGSFTHAEGLEFSVDSFWMSKYEVTVGQWRTFLDKTGLAFDWAANSFGEQSVARYSPSDRHPIVNVSWNQASSFMEWLHLKTGKSYRLATEAEWEYAARGGRQDEFATQTGQIDTNLANCLGCGSEWDNQMTAPVGSFPPNPFGIHDLSGNVWEWCSDWMRDYPKGVHKNPKGADEGTHKVARGGSWNNQPNLVRTTHRGSIHPGYRSQFMGFRVVVPHGKIK